MKHASVSKIFYTGLFVLSYSQRWRFELVKHIHVAFFSCTLKCGYHGVGK